MVRVKDQWLDRNRKRNKRWGLGKRWLAIWQENGKEYSKAFTSKDAALAHLTRISHDMRAGDYVSERDNVTMADYWSLFRQQKAGMSRSTKAMYESIWTAHIEPMWADVPIKSLRPLEVQSWLGLLQSSKGKPMSASQKNKVLITMRALCELALSDEKIKKNPLANIKPERAKAAERRYLTVAQADRLLEAAGNNRLEVEILLKLGLRRGEMAGIKVSDLDPKRGRILIQRSIDIDGTTKATKNRKSREVPAPPELMAQLVDKSKTLKQTDYIFLSHLGKPWTRDSWDTLWQKIAPASGLDNLLTHELRHTAVSWAIQAGANVKMVQRMVGHATAAMTLDVYGHLWDDELDTVMVRVEQFIESERSAFLDGAEAEHEI